jgi:hypothetical protein
MPQTLVLHDNIASGATRNILLSAMEAKEFSGLARKVVGHGAWYVGS